MENSVKPPRACDSHQLKQTAGNINVRDLSQSRGETAILKIEDDMARAKALRHCCFCRVLRRARQNARIKSPVERIAPALEKVVAGGLRRAPDAPLLAWPLACGSAVAARTRALGFTRGVLQVEVPDAGWRAELQHFAPQYLAVVNRYVSGNVSRIEFVLPTK